MPKTLGGINKRDRINAKLLVHRISIHSGDTQREAISDIQVLSA